MSKKDEALKLALELLDKQWQCTQVWSLEEAQDVADNIREALAEQPAQQEPVAWRNAAIRVGEDLSSVGPDGYYEMTAAQWLDWAMAQEPRGKTSLNVPPANANAGKPWVGLTDEEIEEAASIAFYGYMTDKNDDQDQAFARAIEAKLREKNA